MLPITVLRLKSIVGFSAERLTLNVSVYSGLLRNYSNISIPVYQGYDLDSDSRMEEVFIGNVVRIVNIDNGKTINIAKNRKFIQIDIEPVIGKTTHDVINYLELLPFNAKLVSLGNYDNFVLLMAEIHAFSITLSKKEKKWISSLKQQFDYGYSIDLLSLPASYYNLFSYNNELPTEYVIWNRLPEMLEYVQLV